MNVLKKYDNAFIENRKTRLESNKKNLELVRAIQIGGVVLAIIGFILFYNKVSNEESWIFSAILAFIGTFAAILGSWTASYFK